MAEKDINNPSNEKDYVKEVLGDLNINVETLKPINPEKSIEYININENPLDILKTKEEKKEMLEREKRLNVMKSWAYLPMKTNGEKLMYGCGAAYLSGLCGGGIYGFVKGWTKPQPVLNYKLRLNRALNMSTRYGPWAGSSMGVLGIMYTSIDSLLHYARNDKPNDYYNHIGAGFLSGALFKSTAGLKVATLSGGIFAGMVALCGLGSKVIKESKEKLKEQKKIN